MASLAQSVSAPPTLQTVPQPIHKLDINIESPFIKVVQECIIKTFKSNKKFIEKEVNTLVNKITQIKKLGATAGPQTVIESLDGLISKLNQLKTKYNKMLEAEDYLFEVMKKRIRHLDMVVENQGNAEIMKDYFTKRLNRIILDYLLRENYFDSAKTLIDESGLKEFADLEVYEETSRIINKLKHRDCKEALEWCNVHKTKLQKQNSQLEFKLRIQEYMELIKSNQYLKAREYAQKNFNKFDTDKEIFQTIQKVMGMLAYRQERIGQNQNYPFYSDEKRWQEVENLFLRESLQLYGQPETPMIAQSLQTGIPVLKMEFCMKNDTFNEQCPTCSGFIRKLGQKLPYSHHQQTCITCKVTGEVMNDQNQPMYLPSSYVISEKAIDIILDKQTNKLVCPFTKKQFNRSEVRKVFFS